mmetsp:Transcript_52273/g.145864  ORF Transcript_52273/g.145864 Transcript_52273/m.145864 type:complete len:251 (+) Transcript_52273:54-806(+)
MTAASHSTWHSRPWRPAGRHKNQTNMVDSLSGATEVMPILAKFHRGALSILAAHSSVPIATVHEGINLCKSGLSKKVRNQVLKIDNAYKLARHITGVYADALLADLHHELAQQPNPSTPESHSSDPAFDVHSMRSLFEAKFASLQAQIDALHRPVVQVPDVPVPSPPEEEVHVPVDVPVPLAQEELDMNTQDTEAEQVDTAPQAALHEPPVTQEALEELMAKFYTLQAAMDSCCENARMIAERTAGNTPT